MVSLAYVSSQAVETSSSGNAQPPAAHSNPSQQTQQFLEVAAELNVTGQKYLDQQVDNAHSRSVFGEDATPLRQHTLRPYMLWVPCQLASFDIHPCHHKEHCCMSFATKQVKRLHDC